MLANGRGSLIKFSPKSEPILSDSTLQLSNCEPYCRIATIVV
jgi:hypothetical protein